MNIKFILLTFFFSGLLQDLFAYPISPRPLRKLIGESEIIVVADVTKIEKVVIDDHWVNSKAILVVKDILQGYLDTNIIHVYFSPGMICPKPAKYCDSTMVIAFLDKRKNKDGYSTHALSYGSKTLDRKGINLYKKRITEMQTIHKIKNEQKRRSKNVEWFIKCAKHPQTRWEGIYELAPLGNFILYYDHNKKTFAGNYPLNQNQKSELRKILFSINYLDNSDVLLVDIVKKNNDTELINFLIKYLKNSGTKRIWLANSLMKRIALFTERDDLKLIVNKMDNIDSCVDDLEKEMKKFIKEFINKI